MARTVVEGITIRLDGAHFQDVRFLRCHFLYGGGSVYMVGCEIEYCRWTFDGPAGNTLNYLAKLYRDGARKLVEATFKSIRLGAFDHNGEIDASTN